MSLYLKADMKDLLSEGLYLVMQEKPFEKITIKQICDKTGVIRGTFYNHFFDKYEALEYLTKKLLIDDLDPDFSFDDAGETLGKLIDEIYENKEFFVRCFKIEGQNSFQGMLQHIFEEYFLSVTAKSEVKPSVNFITKEFLATYHAASFIFIIKTWLDKGCKESCEEIVYICKTLFTNSLKEIVDFK